MKMRPTLSALLGAAVGASLLAGLVGLATARPAPWFKWRSKTNPSGPLVCAQTGLGAGWEKVFGPYQDSHCEKRDPHE